MVGGEIIEVGGKVGSPVQAGGVEEGGREPFWAVLSEDRVDALLTRGIGGTAERQRDRP